jgi:pimeloyl-ACP methyl ester carboxylesterase
MKQVTSKDGTRIAFEQVGSGPPLIVVVGAFNTRSTGAPLAASMASSFSVFTYDRRGRGDSGDTSLYSVEREIDDLEAMIGAAGGAAAVFGYSSGACLAFEAAARGLRVTKLALYDAPYLPPNGQPQHTIDHVTELRNLVASGRRGDAVEYFQSKYVGIPDDVVAQLRHAPFRPALEVMAHTLVYEALILGDRSFPYEVARRVKVPTLVMAGGAGAPFMRETAEALGGTLHAGQAEILEGQTHDIEPARLAPVLHAFLSDGAD